MSQQSDHASSCEAKLMSRKFLMVTTVNVLSTALLMLGKLGSTDWVDTTKWSVSTYLAANVLGDKISFHGEKHRVV
jgi:hypothetical protein